MFYEDEDEEQLDARDQLDLINGFVINLYRECWIKLKHEEDEQKKKLLEAKRDCYGLVLACIDNKENLESLYEQSCTRVSLKEWFSL